MGDAKVENEPIAPKKANFRQRAHCNPLSDTYLVYPQSPDYVDWSVHYASRFGKIETMKMKLNTIEYPITYPTRIDAKYNGSEGLKPEILDIGCGYGGLMMAIAPLFPETLILGMEIREKVTSYVGHKICALRHEPSEKHKFDNVAVLRTNVMKFLVNYFRKGQVSKMFFCFPDPHFKRSNTRRRIIGPSLLTLYAYVLKEGGLIYTVTDVLDLHIWMRNSLRAHPMFEEVVIDGALRQKDPCINAMETQTEEGKKVIRSGKPCYSTVFRRTHNNAINASN